MKGGKVMGILGARHSITDMCVARSQIPAGHA